MKLKVYLVFLSVLMVITASCGNSGSVESGKNKTADNKIIQQDDGTISLDISKASCYNNSADPSSNTAEWSFVVSRAGRYNVWLSSATTDTLNLNYNTSVKITLLDERLEVKPVGDKIVLDTRDVRRPYFRADSYMGSFYIQDPGEYTIQLISEKVASEAMATEGEKESSPSTKLMSVILTPMTR
jgi:hypothetical protein